MRDFAWAYKVCWATSYIANWFDGEIPTSVMVSEQVVPRVKRKGHMCSTPLSCVVQILDLKIRHT